MDQHPCKFLGILGGLTRLDKVFRETGLSFFWWNLVAISIGVGWLLSSGRYSVSVSDGGGLHSLLFWASRATFFRRVPSPLKHQPDFTHHGTCLVPDVSHNLVDEIIVDSQLVKDNLIRTVVTSKGPRSLREFCDHLFVMVYAKQFVTTATELHFTAPPAILRVFGTATLPEEGDLENDLPIFPDYGYTNVVSGVLAIISGAWILCDPIRFQGLGVHDGILNVNGLFPTVYSNLIGFRVPFGKHRFAIPWCRSRRRIHQVERIIRNKRCFLAVYRSVLKERCGSYSYYVSPNEMPMDASDFSGGVINYRAGGFPLNLVQVAPHDERA